MVSATFPQPPEQLRICIYHTSAFLCALNCSLCFSTSQEHCRQVHPPPPLYPMAQRPMTVTLT